MDLLESEWRLESVRCCRLNGVHADWVPYAARVTHKCPTYSTNTRTLDARPTASITVSVE